MRLPTGTARPEPATGYAHQSYAHSLSEWGSPRELPKSRGWILERPIGETNYRDGMGCYPIFSCNDWKNIKEDLDEIREEMVCLSLVSDPFGNYTEQNLHDSFHDFVVPFKEHFVADLTSAPDSILSKHHRYYAKKALAKIVVEKCEELDQYVDVWTDLYAHLTERHHLSGLKAFSREAFARQFKVPGLVMLRATYGGRNIGAHLWFVQGDVAHSHLAAVNGEGYELLAAYGLYRVAFDVFANKVRWLNFGGGPGVTNSSVDGLTRFKRGWSSETRTAYFCGRIFDHERYAQLCASKSLADNSYFPAYRAGELA